MVEQMHGNEISAALRMVNFPNFLPFFLTKHFLQFRGETEVLIATEQLPE